MPYITNDQHPVSARRERILRAFFQTDEGKEIITRYKAGQIHSVFDGLSLEFDYYTGEYIIIKSYSHIVNKMSGNGVLEYMHTYNARLKDGDVGIRVTTTQNEKYIDKVKKEVSGYKEFPSQNYLIPYLGLEDAEYDEYTLFPFGPMPSILKYKPIKQKNSKPAKSKSNRRK